jgi:hypothetical protein
MTAAQFRRIALSMPQATEASHMNHPDFRVGGKIFATLGYPDKRHGMVVLPPNDQAEFLKSHPAVFVPAKGAWGKQGSTSVRLDAVDPPTLRRALKIAWSNRAKVDRSKDVFSAAENKSCALRKLQIPKPKSQANINS